MAIELSRNITFGQYLDLGSPVHQLDPRTKIIITGLMMAAILIGRNFTGLLIRFGFAIVIQLTSRTPLGYTLRGLRFLAIAMMIIFVFQVLFFPNPPAPWWQWDVLSISPEGVRNAMLTALRVLLLYHLNTTLMFTTGLMDLADGIERMFNPLKRLRMPVNELVMTFVIALKFVPLLIGEIERMIKARAARGERLDEGSLRQRVQRLGRVLVPLFVNSLGRAEIVTTAMNARCYRGGQGRTRLRVLRMRRADWVALALGTLVAASALLVGRMEMF